MFDSFYTNPTIAALARYPLWTVTDPRDKKPIDIDVLDREGFVIGCSLAKNPRAAQTLDAVDAIYRKANKTPSNHALRISATSMNVCVMDIEKTCPVDMQQMFLDTLPYLYAERSLSGQGLHLILPPPSQMAPHTRTLWNQKTVLREPHGFFEILLSHWCTFTHNALEPSISPHVSSPHAHDAWSKLVDQVCASQSTRQAHMITQALPPITTVDQWESILHTVLSSRSFAKTVEDYHNDMSRFEYAAAFFWAHAVADELRFRFFNTPEHPEYTPLEVASLVKECLSAHLSYREKHDHHLINGVPYLDYTASQAAFDVLASRPVYS